MKTQSDGQHWFVLLDGKRHGPFTYADLTKAAREGLITAETNIWRSGWKNWHVAKSVKGLVAVNERSVNETPLAPDGTEWADEQMRPPEEEVLQYAPQHQRREARRSQQPQDAVALRWERQPAHNKAEHIFADEWRMLAEQPAQERGKANVPARAGHKPPARLRDNDAADDDSEYRLRGAAAHHKSFARQLGVFLKRAVGLAVVLLLAAGGWVLLQSGVLRSVKSIPGLGAAPIAVSGDLSAEVAGLPAVVALQRNDPAAFERFKKRFTDSAVNARGDEVMTLARNALRKSVKPLLAISPGDVLLEITETSLAYLQGLQTANPESCVALSDETKGARLTSNLAKDLPIPFVREMSVLERIANANPHMAIAPMSDEEARPYFEKVANALRRQAVRTELQARERLEPSEFAPYCALVIAFYQAVLDLPRDDKINVLRNLYAKAAVNADRDLAR